MVAEDEHGVHVEDLADGGSIVVLAVCGDSFTSSARPDAQGGRLDVKGDG